VREIESSGGKAIAHIGDVADAKAVQAKLEAKGPDETQLAMALHGTPTLQRHRGPSGVKRALLPKYGPNAIALYIIGMALITIVAVWSAVETLKHELEENV